LPAKRLGMVKRLVDRYLEHHPDFDSWSHDIFRSIVSSTKHGILGDISACLVPILLMARFVHCGTREYSILYMNLRGNAILRPATAVVLLRNAPLSMKQHNLLEPEDKTTIYCNCYFRAFSPSM
jgi:hypothetical protein